MINIESKVFDTVYKKVIAEYPTAFVASEYVRKPESFPHVSLIEMDNSVYVPASALTKIENAVTTMYEVNIYSNLAIGKKDQAKNILSIVDNELLGLGFIRTMAQPTPNLEDATIYRILARYEKIVTNEEV